MPDSREKVQSVKLVHIEWIDSTSATGWTPLSEIEEELDVTHSVGFLMNEGSHFIVLAHSFDPSTESANGLMTIPRQAIEKMRTICRIKMK